MRSYHFKSTPVTWKAKSTAKQALSDLSLQSDGIWRRPVFHQDAHTLRSTNEPVLKLGFTLQDILTMENVILLIHLLCREFSLYFGVITILLSVQVSSSFLCVCVCVCVCVRVFVSVCVICVFHVWERERKREREREILHTHL